MFTKEVNNNIPIQKTNLAYTVFIFCRVDENKADLALRLKELDISKQKILRLEKIIEQQKSQNDTLQRKIIYIEGKFQRDRDYMRTVHNVLNTQALPNPNIRKVGVA